MVLALLPLVLHEDAEQRVAGPLPVVEGDAVVERDELALLDHVGDEVGPDLRDEVAQLLEARRHDVDRHDAHDEADEGRQGPGTGRSSRSGGMPAALMTISSESPLSLFSV